jgi:hypothetical protein
MVPGPQYRSASLRVSIPVQSAKKNMAVVAIVVILAIAGWPQNRVVTSVLNSTVALQRTWHVLSQFQEKVSSRSCKTPHNHHHFHHHHNHFCPPSRRQKKLPPIAPPNNDKWPGDQILPLKFISHQRNGRLRNGPPQQPWPGFGNKFSIRIHHFHHQHKCFCPPGRRKKKLPPIAPLSNNEWPEDQILPLKSISHRRNARPQNGLPQRP